MRRGGGGELEEKTQKASVFPQELVVRKCQCFGVQFPLIFMKRLLAPLTKQDSFFPGLMTP